MTITTDVFQSLAVTVVVEGAKFTILTIYKPPDSNTIDFNNSIMTLFQKALVSSAGTIIVGDFNFPDLNWISTSTTGLSSSLQFKNGTIKLGLDQVIKFPTRGQNLLDLTFVSNKSLINKIDKLDPFGEGTCFPPSDHHAFAIDTNITLINKGPRFKFKNFNKADWHTMADALDNIDWNSVLNPTILSVNRMLNIFLSFLQDLIDLHVPTYRKTNSRSYCIHDPILLKLLATERRLGLRLKRLNAGTSTPNDNRRLTETHLAKIRVSRHIKRLTARSVKQKESDILRSKDNNKFWKYIKSRTKLSQNIPALVDESGSQLLTDQSKATCFGKTFNFRGVSVPNSINSCSNKTFSFYPLFPTETIIAKIKALPNNNAASFDKIPNKFLKKLNRNIAVPLSRIFNIAYYTGSFPDTWKYAKVIPVYKKGDKSSPANYRPISLNSTISKVFESIVKDFALNACISLNLINPSQFGFLPKKSVSSQLLKCHYDWAINLDAKHDTDVAYLDLTKAFDSIPHNILIQKIIHLGFPDHFIDFAKSYLADRKQSVVINAVRSNPSPVNFGVPQGSVLGPFLFVLFINDLPDVIRHSNIYLYADDIKIYKTIKSTSDTDLLQSDLNATDKWLKLNGLIISPHKSAILTIGNNAKITRSYNIGNSEIPNVESFRDLGVIIDRSLNFSMNTSTVCNKSSRQSNCMRTSFHTRETFFRIKMFKTFTLPIIDFCSSISHPISQGDKKDIEAVQRRFTKYLPRMYCLTYRDRCKTLKIHPLIIRFYINDLVSLHKMINHQFADVNPRDYITFSQSNTRGHNLRIFRSHQHNGNAMSNFLPYRIMNLWNSLPSDIVQQPTAKAFKSAIHTNIDLLYNYLDQVNPSFLD